MQPSTKNDMLTGPDFSEQDRIWLSNQFTLRRLIGGLGMLLPLLLWFCLWIDTGRTCPMESISHYYYTRVSGILIIVVSMLAIFLLVYKGRGRIDLILSMLAGAFALGLLLFPTNNVNPALQDQHCTCIGKDYIVTRLKVSDARMWFHYIASGIFLVSLAGMAFFVFTKSDKANPKSRTKEKRRRNRIFRVCGVLMVLAILVIVGGFTGLIPDHIYNDYRLTFWMEVLAVEAFGFSWLVKGEVILQDRK